MESRTIAFSSIDGLVPVPYKVKHSKKFSQISASVRTIGLVELPVVVPLRNHAGRYALLDGRLRVEALIELGESSVECLISLDDESYTFNRRISRLASVQENKMIVRALERGVPEEQLASALNLTVKTIRQRFQMLDGICDEAISALSDKPCPMVVFNILKQMKPLRQIQAAELLVGQSSYSSSFARSILAATSPEDLAAPPKLSPKESESFAREQIARLERELEATQRRIRCVEDSYGDDNLCLTIAQTYLGRMLSNPRISEWLALQRPDYLAEFQSIVSLKVVSL